MLLYRVKIIILFILAMQAKCVLAQSLPMQPELILQDSISDFSVDNLGNIFLVTGFQQLKKLDNNYDSVAVFNNVRRYGKLETIDVSNPLKVLLFYRDFNTVVVLDRFFKCAHYY